jgi:hypothetical protein
VEAPHFRGKPVGEEFASVGSHNRPNEFFASPVWRPAGRCSCC